MFGAMIDFDDHVLEDTATLHYIMLCLDTMEACKITYPVGWRSVDYNLYVDSYTIISNRKKITLIWKNKNEDLHSLSFTRFKFRSQLLNKLYFKFVPRLATSDLNRRHNVLGIIYDHFCRETGVYKGDFAAIKSFAQSIDFTLALIYSKFFVSQLSLSDFISIYDPTNTKISHKSVLAISAYVNYLQTKKA